MRSKNSDILLLEEDCSKEGEFITDEEKFKTLYKMLPPALAIASNVMDYRKDWKKCMEHIIDTVPTLKQLQMEYNNGKGYTRECPSERNVYEKKNRSKRSSNKHYRSEGDIAEVASREEEQLD
ncbi:hypothetical protein PIROE2DRAFT_11419 [Piromyces sp. E2]|nr:hypothetical protein PIROE2DRAFT_11419 [Piromyces sp. E2]|eukprot:OUM62318.1 hypothetical protein PIROE2DRAFT_11419 [Piromyces sp. E2]